MKQRRPSVARAARLLCLCGSLLLGGCTFLENEVMYLDLARPRTAVGQPGDLPTPLSARP